MTLHPPQDLDDEDLEKLAGLVVCDRCLNEVENPPQSEPRAVRLPYADD